MSIVRIGLAETQRYSDGWDAIFNKGASKARASKPKATKKAAKTQAKTQSKKSKK